VVLPGGGHSPAAVREAVEELIAQLVGGMGSEGAGRAAGVHWQNDGDTDGPRRTRQLVRQARRAQQGAGGQVVVALEAAVVGPMQANFPLATVIFLTQQQEDQGVEQEVIESKTTTLTMEDESSGDTGNWGPGAGLAAQHKCIVCLEDFEVQEELRVLPCCHRFHRGCIDVWLARNRHCPICKHDITE